jgi:hypothetical protein
MLARLVDIGPAMKSAIITASLLFALAGTASAQPGTTPAAPPSDIEEEPQGQKPSPAPSPWRSLDAEDDPDQEPQPSGELRSGGAAFLLSLGGTTLSWGLLVAGAGEHFGGTNWVGLAGVVLAPSFGNWYAERYFTRGLGVRLVSVAAIVGGFAIAGGSLDLGGGGWNDHGNTPEKTPSEKSAEDLGGMLALVGAIGFVVGTSDDIASAPSNMRDRNRKLSHELGLVPVVTQHQAGLALGGRF